MCNRKDSEQTERLFNLSRANSQLNEFTENNETRHIHIEHNETLSSFSVNDFAVCSSSESASYRQAAAAARPRTFSHSTVRRALELDHPPPDIEPSRLQRETACFFGACGVCGLYIAARCTARKCRTKTTKITKRFS